jgi:hypothetical protein
LIELNSIYLLQCSTTAKRQIQASTEERRNTENGTDMDKEGQEVFKE